MSFFSLPSFFTTIDIGNLIFFHFITNWCYVTRRINIFATTPCHVIVVFLLLSLPNSSLNPASTTAAHEASVGVVRGQHWRRWIRCAGPRMVGGGGGGYNTQGRQRRQQLQGGVGGREEEKEEDDDTTKMLT
ncbi:hypothetical protein GUJ93_ZPchr0006g44524 [Zizania palustris]|uniref:Uncharacterized protein n=1 Tax=Zizania palustris TaxID=103762 RepID=A0A8J5VLB2_ZIZPA|nr:hypothetical protein GUJ93_ZPchr0006g44524 [Zizania palustris]